MAVTGSRTNVGTSPVRIANAGSASEGALVVVRNMSSVVIDLGGSGVTAGAGYPLDQDERAAFELAYGEDLYAIAASGSTNSVATLITRRDI